MGFDLVTGLIVVGGIALVVLVALFAGRRAVKAPDQDEGVNAGSELEPHEPGHVGRTEATGAERR